MAARPEAARSGRVDQVRRPPRDRRQPALSDPDFFGRVKREFINSSADFIEADLRNPLLSRVLPSTEVDTVVHCGILWYPEEGKPAPAEEASGAPSRDSGGGTGPLSFGSEAVAGDPAPLAKSADPV